MSVNFDNLNTSSNSHSWGEYPIKESKEEVDEKPPLSRFKSWNGPVKIKDRPRSFGETRKEKSSSSLLGRIKKSPQIKFEIPKDVFNHIDDLLSECKEGDKHRPLLDLLNKVPHFEDLYVLLRSFIFDEKLLKQIPLDNDFSGFCILPPFIPNKNPVYLIVKPNEVLIPKEKTNEIKSTSKVDHKREKEQAIRDAQLDDNSNDKRRILKVLSKEKIDKENPYAFVSSLKEREHKNLIAWKDNVYDEILRAFYHSGNIPLQSHLMINGTLYPLVDDLTKLEEISKEEYLKKIFETFYCSFLSKKNLPDCAKEVKQFLKKKSFPLLNIMQTFAFGFTAFGIITFKDRYPVLFNKEPFNTFKTGESSFGFYILDLNHFCMVRRINFITSVLFEDVLKFSLNIVQAYHGKKWHYRVVPSGMNLLVDRYDRLLKFAMNMEDLPKKS